MSASIDKVKIVVIGDSGVGKSSLVHLIAHQQVLKKPSWTIGCSVDVKLHEYKDGTVHQKPYFIEFFDIGGNTAHKASTKIFLTSVDGIIMVHDLANIKSQENLKQWLNDVVKQNENMSVSSSDYFSNDTSSKSTTANTSTLNKSQTYYRQQRANNSHSFDYLNLPPILVVGTKLDLAKTMRNSNHLRNASPIAIQFRADEINLDCLDPKYLASATSNSVKLEKYFDKVIENKIAQQNREVFKEKSNMFSIQTEKAQRNVINTANENFLGFKSSSYNSKLK